jgi:hypothetical protein
VDNNLVELNWVVELRHINCPSKHEGIPTFVNQQQSVTPKGMAILSACEACGTKVLYSVETPELIRQLMEEES